MLFRSPGRDAGASRSYHRRVAMWHCPHCGAPQAETARCWVCRRSSTTCSTCVNFRRSLAGDLGYCALDHRRRPLTGREQRGCWEGRAVATEPPAPLPAPEAHRLRAASRPRGFVPLEHGAREFVPLEFVEPVQFVNPPDEGPTAGPAPAAPPPFVIAEADEDWSKRTSLFGESEA